MASLEVEGRDGQQADLDDVAREIRLVKKDWKTSSRGSLGSRLFGCPDMTSGYNTQPINTMLHVNDHDHDRIIHLLDKLEHAVQSLDDQGYPADHPSFCDAVARLDGAKALFDIVNGNV